MAFKALDTFRRRIRQITRRTGGRSLREVADALQRYVPGGSRTSDWRRRHGSSASWTNGYGTAADGAGSALAARDDDIPGAARAGREHGSGCAHRWQRKALVAQQPHGAEPAHAYRLLRPTWESPDSPDLNFSNRPVRTRMPGGVGGDRSAMIGPYPDFWATTGLRDSPRQRHRASATRLRRFGCVVGGALRGGIGIARMRIESRYLARSARSCCHEGGSQANTKLSMGVPTDAQLGQ